MKANYINIVTRDELYRLDCSKVVYMEGDGNYTHIVMKNKLKASVCMNLSEMQKLISESLKERATIFARVGKRFIINLNYVYQINPIRQFLILTDGELFAFQLGISKMALKQLKDLIVQNVNNKNNKKK